MGGLGLAGALLLAIGSATVAHPGVGDVAPPYTIMTFDRAVVASEAMRGQVVVLNFWATWCAPCKKELPLLDAYARRHPESGLRVFAIATEDSVAAYRLKPLAAALAFPLALRIKGAGLSVMTGVPTNYVIDRRGVVRYAAAGAFDDAALERIVTPLLAEPGLAGS